MDKHDRELLDKQVGRLTPARRGQGVLMVAIAGMFLVGIIVGGLMLARNTEPRVQVASSESDGPSTSEILLGLVQKLA
jgi:hypothetical protein